MSTWRVSWQDYRGWPHRAYQAPPKVEFEDYETKEMAVERAGDLRKHGMTVSVSPTPSPKRGRQPRRAPFNADWRLKA